MRCLALRFTAGMGLAWLLSISPALKADERSASQCLGSLGLCPSVTRFSAQFLLRDESKVNQAIRKVAMEKERLLAEQQKLVANERDVKDRSHLVPGWAKQWKELEGELKVAANPMDHNRIARAMNDLKVMIDLAEAGEKELAPTWDALVQRRGHYAEGLLQLRRQYDQLKGRYQTLSSDPEVQSALAEYNEGRSKPYQILPSSKFVDNEETLKRLEQAVLAESVPMRPYGSGLWTVSALFDEKHQVQMVVDTGASTIVLSWDEAAKVGLTPGPDDQVVVAHTAGGIVKGRRVLAKSVRVGSCTAENVECVVMAADASRVPLLLGQSFLKRFSYRIDSAGAQFFISTVKEPQENVPAR